MTKLEQRIVRIIGKYGGKFSPRVIQDLLNAEKAELTAAIESLHKLGHLQVETLNGKVTIQLTEKGWQTAADFQQQKLRKLAASESSKTHQKPRPSGQ